MVESFVAADAGRFLFHEQAGQLAESQRESRRLLRRQPEHGVGARPRPGREALWQRGFFGKGNLSRSEPTWRQRKVNEIDALRKGRMTAEQLTQQRREERKALKIERARAAVRAGQQLPDGILALGGR